jgi:CDP-diacylglycerol--serine O-phosphatidyltransferase
MTDQNDQGKAAKKSASAVAEGAIQQLDELLPVDDFEEEVEIGDTFEKRKGIYILPNLFTSAALFAGFYSILSSMQGHFEAAAISIFIAMIFDILDGRIARMINAQSKFGAEYDSLSDMVSFGVAPAVAMFSWALHDLNKVGFMAAFIYVAGAALRLARFNTQPPSTDKRYFIGLASPASAAFLAAMLWVATDYGWHGEDLPFSAAVAVTVLTVLCGLMMVSNLKYPSFKGINFAGRVPFVVILLVIMAFAVIGMDPPIAILTLITLYNLSFVLALLRKS